jgi:hypothetical protein
MRYRWIPLGGSEMGVGLGDIGQAVLAMLRGPGQDTEFGSNIDI